MNSALAHTGLQAAIRGKIGDPQDFPVASARVCLSGSKLPQKISAMTGFEGYFVFSRIPPGTYTLEVIYEGFSKLVQHGIAVQEHAITGLDLKMDFLEDSRALKLRALSLEFINSEPQKTNSAEPSQLARPLSEVVAGLRLDRALFNPPPAVKVGQPVMVEFGIYQNLKETIMRRLQERNIGLFEDGQVIVSLHADLQAAGCLVLPKTLPKLAINGARYVEWRWELLPQAFGLGLIRLDLRLGVDFKGHRGEDRSLLLLDREMLIRKNRWLTWKHVLKNALETGERTGHSDR